MADRTCFLLVFLLISFVLAGCTDPARNETDELPEAPEEPENQQIHEDDSPRVPRTTAGYAGTGRLLAPSTA